MKRFSLIGAIVASLIVANAAVAQDLREEVAKRLELFDRAVACLERADFSGGQSSDLAVCESYHDAFHSLFKTDKILFDNDYFCLARSLNAVLLTVKLENGDLTEIDAAEPDIALADCRSFVEGR